MFEDNIPPLLPPDEWPPIQTQTDVYRQWRALMGELGFSTTTLWVLMLTPAGTPAGEILTVEEIPDVPGRRELGQLLQMLGSVLDDTVGPGASVAFLRSRPGPSTLTTSDRLWARRLLEAAREHDVAAWAMHLATDEALVVVAPDDLSDAHPA